MWLAQLKSTRQHASQLDDERARLERAVRQLQISDEQQRTLLLDTRRKLHKANEVVMEAQRLARLEYIASKDFKQNMSRLLKEAMEQRQDGDGAADSKK